MQISFSDKQALHGIRLFCYFVYQQFLAKGQLKLPFFGDVNINVNGNPDFKMLLSVQTR